MGRFDSDKGAAFGGNYLNLKDGEQAIVRVLDIGDSFNKTFEKSGNTVLCKNFLCHVEAFRDDPEGPWQQIEEQRRWSPAVRTIVEFIALCDYLDQFGEHVIHGRRLILKRKDREGKNGYKFGWVQVHDQGDWEGISSGVPAVPRNSANPDQAYPSAKVNDKPIAAPATPPAAAAAPTAGLLDDVAALPYVEAKKGMAAKYTSANAAGKQAIVDAWRPMRDKKLTRLLDDSRDGEDLDKNWEFCKQELKSDAAALELMQLKYSQLSDTLNADIPF